MKVTTTTRIGGVDITFETEDSDTKSALLEAIGLATPRDTCNVCGGVGLDTKRLNSYRTSDNIVYVTVECECGAKSDLGTYRAGGHFWKEYARFDRDGQNGNGGTPTPAAPPAPEPIAPETIRAIADVLSSRNKTPQQVASTLRQRYGVTKLRDLTAEQGAELQERLASTR